MSLPTVGMGSSRNADIDNDLDGIDGIDGIEGIDGTA